MPPDPRTRVLIVDDSAVMRNILRKVVAMEPSFEVAGTAADGESALRMVREFQPDLILLDVEMPVMDGLATLRRLRASGHRAPVIMCSASTQRGARVTIEALAAGAADYVAKPASQADAESAVRKLAEELLAKARILSGRGQSPPLPLPSPSAPRIAAGFASAGSVPARMAVVVIGVSTGGPAALEVVLPRLDPRFPLPVLVVQHMPENFTPILAQRLNGQCNLAVREAAEGNAVRPGTVYVARGDQHLQILPARRPGSAATLHLARTAPENHCRPSVDVLLRSAASVYGAGVVAVILTGMGSDGLAGCEAVRRAGGTVLVQDQTTSTVWGMPGAVALAGLADRVLPLDNIAVELERMAGSRTAEECREGSA